MNSVHPKFEPMVAALPFALEVCEAEEAVRERTQRLIVGQATALILRRSGVYERVNLSSQWKDHADVLDAEVNAKSLIIRGITNIPPVFKLRTCSFGNTESELYYDPNYVLLTRMPVRQADIDEFGGWIDKYVRPEVLLKNTIQYATIREQHLIPEL